LKIVWFYDITLVEKSSSGFLGVLAANILGFGLALQLKSTAKELLAIGHSDSAKRA
jgi:hypothetical protein